MPAIRSTSISTSRATSERSVEPFASSRPAGEVGCLYYSNVQSAFVDSRKVSDAVPHFGRPGGIVPRVDRP